MENITFTSFDTLCRVAFEKPADTDGSALLVGVRGIANDVHSRLSMYDDRSELSRLCQDYKPGAPIKVSELLFEFLRRTLEISRLSGGALDPTVAPYMRLWDYSSGHPKIPSDEALIEASHRIGWESIELGVGTITLHKSRMEIDPGASGKGYALDLAARYLRENGVQRGFIDFGGNLYAFGKRDHKEPWRVAIRHPDHAYQSLGVCHLENMAIATSSWYEHCFSEGDQLCHHILDPRTGRPVSLKLKSVSIISSDAMLTDVLSTAVFVLGLEEGFALIDKVRAITKETIEYVIVSDDDCIHKSSGLSFMPEVQSDSANDRSK